MYRTLNPTTEELVATYSLATPAEIAEGLNRSVGGFEVWRQSSHGDRRELLEELASRLEQRSEGLAILMAEEMGKPLAQGRAEVTKCAWVCRYYADNLQAFLKAEVLVSDASYSAVHYEPLGPILAIMPWNFPLWQVFRFLAPALAIGNVAVLKHAPSTPGCALAIADLFDQVGAPAGLLVNLFLSNEQVAEVIADRRICGVTLTGSTEAGRAVAELAGRALKPIVLELGGSDPLIIFEDADLESAVKTGVLSRTLNSGQSCIAAKRFLVAEPVYREVVEAITRTMKGLEVGSPFDEKVEIGPLARRDIRDRLVSQVESALAVGARVLCGGEVPNGAGFFYPPTVLIGLDPDESIAGEEFFGPVAVVQPFVDEEEAVRLANNSTFGLGASLWSADRARLDRLIPQIVAGSVFLNGLVKSDPRLPFGGTRESGLGRELGRAGMLEFANAKTVWRA